MKKKKKKTSYPDLAPLVHPLALRGIPVSVHPTDRQRGGRPGVGRLLRLRKGRVRVTFGWKFSEKPCWLVVYQPPLKNMKVSWEYSSKYMGK